MRAQPKASHFVNGAWMEDEAGDALIVTYPGTGEVIAKLHAATPAVIDAAIEGAVQAQKAGPRCARSSGGGF